jgi:hypothetical protein
VPCWKKLPEPLELHELTVPVAWIAVPELESLALAVQTVVTPTTGLLGTHVIDVVVLRLITLRANGLALLLLVECELSPPYDAVMFWIPSLPGAGVKLTEHLATPVETWDRVQLAGEKLPPRLTLVAQPLTDPVGVVAVPPLLSVTVAVQTMGALTAIELGVQLTEVEVDRVPTLTEAGLALLSLLRWSVSPT